MSAFTKTSVKVINAKNMKAMDTNHKTQMSQTSFKPPRHVKIVATKKPTMSMTNP